MNHEESEISYAWYEIHDLFMFIWVELREMKLDPEIRKKAKFLKHNTSDIPTILIFLGLIQLSLHFFDIFIRN